MTSLSHFHTNPPPIQEAFLVIQAAHGREIVEIKGKQWLNLSDHVVVVICLARGAIAGFLGAC